MYYEVNGYWILPIYACNYFSSLENSSSILPVSSVVRLKLNGFNLFDDQSISQREIIEYSEND